MQKYFWCEVCHRLLPIDGGVIVHDDVPHPDTPIMHSEETLQ